VKTLTPADYYALVHKFASNPEATRRCVVLASRRAGPATERSLATLRYTGHPPPSAEADAEEGPSARIIDKDEVHISEYVEEIIARAA